MIKLIGINGRLNSGKDSIGEIIQNLTTPKRHRIVTDEFGGPERDSSGKYVLEEEYSAWTIKKFAGKLKQVASLMTGIPMHKFEDQEFKKTNLSGVWDTKGVPMTVRTFLQVLGTEAMRDCVHTNAWVNGLFSDWSEDSRWVITDTRFPNEAQAVKDKGGIVIRVNRPCSTCGKYDNSICSNGYHITPQHPSETSLDDWDFDYIIDNSAGLIELKDKVSEMLAHFNIISDK